MDERVSDPEPGMHWKKPPPRLASPSARAWRLQSSGCRVRAEIDFAMASASSRPNSAMAKALPVSCGTRSRSASGGSRNDGNAFGNDPIISTFQPSSQTRKDTVTRASR